jgi:hypothetical protein
MLVVDSGLGGRRLMNRLRSLGFKPRLATGYFPWGKRKEKELAEIIITLIEQKIKSTHEPIIIACNTAVVVKAQIKKRFRNPMLFAWDINSKKFGRNRRTFGSTLLSKHFRRIEPVDEFILQLETNKKLRYPHGNLACTHFGVQTLFPEVVKFLKEVGDEQND